MGKHGEATPLTLHRLSMRAPAGMKTVTQAMIASWATYPSCQGQVSKIERGHLPSDPIEQKNWARAYRLSLKRFALLVEASRGWDVLPLWRYAQVEPTAVVEMLRPIAVSTNPHAPAGTIVRAQA